uniref:Sulfatase N-terminal domain-containing protein n=1 Tax=Lotharella oceanica TaxID=641309 RepID=A0A7S2TXL1_9EUKA
MNNWEGGIRAAALVAGGALPEPVLGTKVEGMIHLSDWYGTFCFLAGIDPFDKRAARSLPHALPPVESVNVWQVLSGQNMTSPRTDFAITPLGEDTNRPGEDAARHGGDAAYMAEGRYKLIVGYIRQAGWCGQIHPNTTSPWNAFDDIQNCTTLGSEGKIGCLYDVLNDPSERQDLAATMPSKALEIFHKLQIASRLWFNPERGAIAPEGCIPPQETGFWQPFLP